MNNDSNSVTLSTYLNNVQHVIKTHCADAIWVRAEITNCSSKGGHYYLELAEKILIHINELPPPKPPFGSSSLVVLSLSLKKKQTLNLAKTSTYWLS
jgi:exodeoxyribonuclease VII large subunit